MFGPGTAAMQIIVRNDQAVKMLGKKKFYLAFVDYAFGIPAVSYYKIEADCFVRYYPIPFSWNIHYNLHMHSAV